MLIDLIIILISLGLIFIGLLGIFLPFLPGVPVAWAGLLLYAYHTNFLELSTTLVLIFLGITIFTMIVDLIAPIIGAKKYSASKYGILGASLGLLFGIFILGPIGILVGPFVGAMLGELLIGKTEKESMRAAFGTFLGFLAGTVIKLVAVLSMAGFLIYSLLF